MKFSIQVLSRKLYWPLPSNCNRIMPMKTILMMSPPLSAN